MPRAKKNEAPSARERARAARNDVYREHILEAAETVFAQSGFDAAKLQDISRLAALSMGTIYAIFPGKNELLSAILEQRGREMLQLARAVVDRGEDPGETLDALIAAYVGYFVDHPMFLQMHLRQGVSWVLTPADGGNGRARIWDEIHQLQSELFRRGIAAKKFLAEDPGFLAKAFSALDQVLLADWVGNGMKESRESLISRMQQLAVRLFRTSR